MNNVKVYFPFYYFLVFLYCKLWKSNFFCRKTFFLINFWRCRIRQSRMKLTEQKKLSETLSLTTRCDLFCKPKQWKRSMIIDDCIFSLIYLLSLQYIMFIIITTIFIIIVIIITTIIKFSSISIIQLLRYVFAILKSVLLLI